MKQYNYFIDSHCIDTAADEPWSLYDTAKKVKSTEIPVSRTVRIRVRRSESL